MINLVQKAIVLKVQYLISKTLFLIQSCFINSKLKDSRLIKMLSLAVNHDFDAGTSERRLERLDRFLESESMSDQRLDVDLSGSHELAGDRITVLVTKDAANVQLFAAGLHQRHRDLGRAHSDDDDRPARPRRVNRQSDARWRSTALDCYARVLAEGVADFGSKSLGSVLLGDQDGFVGA